jgi:predicted MPP superfamily phosphohydrolase
MNHSITLVHLSDIHLGGGYFVSDWGARVIEQVNRVNPELMIITGESRKKLMAPLWTSYSK